MKTKKIYIAALSCVLFLTTFGCSDILEEQPRAILTPDFFTTAEGIEGGIVAAYADLRYFYVNETPAFGMIFSDEYTNGTQISNPPIQSHLGLSPADGRIGDLWNRAYPAINTCNGVIELAAQSTDLTEDRKAELIAEAKFLRGVWYFMLVRFYGGATLDFGSGPLAFNRTPTAQASRATLAATYDVVISDLAEAAATLPDAAPQEGRVWRASAYHQLAKAYLTRAQSDASQSTDLQNALNAVQALIPDATSRSGNFGTRLLDDYAQVHEEGNEYNDEVLFTSNRNGNEIFTSDGRPNRSHFYFRPFYTGQPRWHNLLRDVENGRPWIRFAPTDWLLETAFDSKDVDSRFAKSFQSVWYANRENGDENYPTWTQADVDAGHTSAANLGQQKFFKGDTAVWVVPDNQVANQTGRQFSAGYHMEIRSQNEEHINRTFYPSLKKNDAKRRPIPGTETNPNIDSTRPYIIDRLADTYLLGAEAAHLMGNNALAAQYINTVRERALWPGQPSGARDITAGDVTIDFILDERSRELCGEMCRWFDLARTGKLAERMEEYSRVSGTTGDYIGVTPGSIKDFHYLRPIPQSQIDLAVDPTVADGKYPQNPGYVGN